MIEPDDFAIWRDNPITQKVFEHFREYGEDCKAMWDAHSWQGGGTDPKVLYELRGQEHVCQLICNVTLEELEEKASG